MSSSPIQTSRLQSLVNEAFETAFDKAGSTYNHDETLKWNSTIINHLTAALVSEVEPATYKFIVNSVIIQHSAYGKNDPGLSRGMHAASGAYWDDERDGTWSYTVVGGPDTGRDFDVIITISWIDIQ